MSTTHKHPPMQRLRALALLTLVALLVSGCSTVKPWVKPYERTNLANPIMSFSRDPVADKFRNHVFEAREGGRGADGGSGGGCGCN